VPEVAGVASSLIGASQNAASAVCAILASLIFANDVRSSIIMMGSLGAATVLLFAGRHWFMAGQTLHGEHV